jgi:dTDP-glucose 4,6-dehydratase
VDRSIQEPRAFAITDVLGTLTLLEAARTHAVKKFVQISTDEVFGSISEGTFTEDSPFAPNSPYAASKAGADHLCRAYYKTYDFPVVVTHSCNYYGPYHYPEKLIPLAITNLLEGKKIPVYGSGSQMREWIYTEDHCSAIDAVLHKGLPGQVYNIGTGDERTNIELLTTLLGLMGKTETDLEFVKDRPGHDFRYALNSEKIRKELGWQPSVRLEEGLQKTVAWFEQNRWWWEKIKAGEFKHYYASQYKNLHDTSNA